MKNHVVILALEFGSNPSNDLQPLCMWKIEGIPILYHIIKSILRSKCERITIVHSSLYTKEDLQTIKDFIDNYLEDEYKKKNQLNINEEFFDSNPFGLQKRTIRYDCILQQNDSGTGHAAAIALSKEDTNKKNNVSNESGPIIYGEISKDITDNVIILYGNIPFVQADTIDNMFYLLGENGISGIVSVVKVNQDSLSERIIFNEMNKIQKIKEYSSLSIEENLSNNLCFAGVIATKKFLFNALLDELEPSKKKLQIIDIVFSYNDKNHHFTPLKVKEGFENIRINKREDLKLTPYIRKMYDLMEHETLYRPKIINNFFLDSAVGIKSKLEPEFMEF